MPHHTTAEHQDEQHTGNEQHDDDNAQTIETLHGIAVRTHQRQTPVGARHGLEGYVIQFAAPVDVNGTLLADSHLVAQCDDVHVLAGVDIGENGLAEQPGGVGMYEKASVSAQQHEVCVGIVMLYFF